MKKFAKILGFLGFFVTLATVQIGSAWAESVECRRGYYLRRGETTCTQCPSAAENNGIGVFCPGNEGEPYEAPAEYDYGIFPCKDQKECSPDYTYDLTPAMATSRDQCQSRCNSAECIHPNSLCPLPDDRECQYQEDNTISGSITCGGTCTAENISDNYCPVTCPTSCNNGRCTCPNNDCTGFDEVNNLPGVHYCRTDANSCDATTLIQFENTIYAQIISANNYQCSAYGDCKVACSHEGNPTCPYPGTTCEWDLNTPVQEGYQQGDDCIDPVTNLPIEPFNCDIIVTGCTDPCQYWDGKECKTYSSTTTYKCGSNTVAGPIDAICGVPYTINRTTDGGSTQIIDTSSCTPSGYRLQGWRLTIDYSPYNQQLFSDPEVPAYNRFNWQATTNNPATFVAEWEEDKLYVYYNRFDGAWVQENPPADDKEAFTISQLPLTKTWTLSRDNSTFRGWCDDLYYSHLSDTTWLNAHCHSPYTIPADTTSDVHLYAWWECTGPYTLNSSYLCEGDKIDVKYTCHAPENSSYNDTSYTYTDAATYGQEYKPVKSVEEVTTASNSAACQFAGYEIDPDQVDTYEWTLLGSTSNSPTNGKYLPDSSMNEWQYISPTPTTEIEFELKSDVWKAKKYTVNYYCGSIDGYTFSGPGYVGDDGAIYNTDYTVANSNVLSEFIGVCVPADGYTLQSWTFACPGYENVPEGPYASGANFGTWTYDSNNCYFTANWAQTDFVIILDSNIDQDPMNNGSDVSDPEELYTRLNYKVYSCPERTNSCEMGSLTAIPTKVVTVTLNGNDGQFTWNNETVSEATDDSKFTFLGFYESEESNSDQYIYGEDDANSGLITNRGKEVGIGYDGTNALYIWYAHWENRDAVILPEPIERPGFTFNGWLCAHEELAPGVDPTLYNGGDPILNGSFVPEDNATCTALWTEACYEIEFNDNGGTPSSNGTHPSYYKKHNDNKWYTNATCASVDYDPTVANNMPSKNHATFTGYYYETQNPDLKIFAGTNDTPQGGLTSDGAAWTVSDNATLYAQYECDDLYHFNPQTNNCEMCPAGSFYDSDAGACKTCNEILQPLTGISGWTSKEGYTWSINQCYRECGTNQEDDGDATKCDMFNNEQFSSEQQFVEITNGTGTQISFYGNEEQGIYTCKIATGATKCPIGLRGNNNSPDRFESAAASVKFNGIAEGEQEVRYIIGYFVPSTLSLSYGSTWSQVVGLGQQSDELTNNNGQTYRYTYIIYPADTAPAAISREHQTFAGYGYPETNATALVNARNLTANNANGIIQFAINLEPAQNNMSPNTQSPYSRNLWPIYTDDPTYTLTYSCGDGGGMSPNPVENIHAGDRIIPAQPEGCTNYGNVQFKWWAVSNSADTHPAGDAGAFEWAYTENKTFTAIWGAANTYNITYLKMPATNNSITPAGNTLEMPSNISMPNSYTCNATPDTSINGVPRLKNADGDYIGEVVAWCKDSTLETCDLPLTLSNAAPCEDKNVYAKWECDAEAGYYLNPAGNDCITCEVGYYWDNGTCRQCPNGWTSNPPYNWTINQCYKLCNGSNNTTIKRCSDDLTPNLSQVPYFANKFLDQGDNPYQITFYGNHQNDINVCEMEDVEYCPAVLRALAATGIQTNKTKASKITFMRQGNMDEAGKRYIVGFLDVNGYYNGNGNFWSHIAGRGQQVTEGNNTYTRIIYPTDTAPSPDSTPNPAFKGYFDGTGSDATQRVAAALGLDSSNAVAFPQASLLENQIGDRTLYPQYCENGQEWDPNANDGAGACIAQAQVYDVKYVCGEHGTPAIEIEMTNTATSGQPYTVAVLDGGVFAACTANTGYVLKTNNSGQSLWYFNGDSSANHYTNEVISQWNFNTQSPQFTAQYDCDDGYTWQDGECKPGTNLCNADFPSGAEPHANISNIEYVNGQCVYEIQCAPCGDGTYGCYDHEGDQLFDITLDPSILVLPDTSFCTPKEYSISYNDTQRTLHFDVDTGTCDPTSYLYGNTIDIDCRLDAPNDSHAVFKGWCTGTNTSTGCAETQSISATDHGDKTYYAWWDCDQNYHQNGLTCDPDGNLPLIYKPNGGQPNEDYTVLLSYGQEFSTEGAIYIKTGNILARWDVAAGGANTFDSHFDDTTNTYYAELGESYSNGYLDTTTTLNAHWEACQCDIGTGVASCNANVVTENACTPVVTCQTGYTNPHIECTGIYNTICRVTCDAEGQYEIILDKNFVVNNSYGPHGSNGQTPLYTIHNTGVYSDQSRDTEMTQTTNPLSTLPQKYYKVTFNHCDGDDQILCSDAAMEVVNANIEFSGFYRYANGGDTYIGYNENLAGWYITEEGIIAGKGYSGEPSNYKWYAGWNNAYGMLFANNWPQDPIRDGYTFVGWYTNPVNGTPVNVSSGYLAYSDTTVYAHWERSGCPDDEILIGTDCKKKCWVNCTWNGRPTNPTTCPSDIANIPYVQDCTYNQDLPAAQGPGYHPYDGSTQCLDLTTNQQITPEPCNYTVNCESPRVWDSDTSSCVYPDGTIWKVNYDCGDSNAHNGSSNGMVMHNIARYNQMYKIAYSDPSGYQIAGCDVKPGYILEKWRLNNNNSYADVTGAQFIWLYIDSDFPSNTEPKFTAQYVCDTDNGYYQNQINGTCQKCPENSYWTGSQCKECDQGYHVNDDGDGCTPNTINLNYSTQCGTSTPQSSTCTFNTEFSLATHNTSTGYTFNGWTTNGNNYTGPFNPGQQIQCTAAYLGNAVYINNATVTITGSCASNNEQCPAQLPTNANLNMSYPLNPTPNAGTCTYHLQCASCIGSNDHDCYTRDGMNSDGTFTVNGPVGNSTVLNNVRCEPATYNAVYKCGAGTPGGPYTDNVTITYNGSYTVLPNGAEAGGVVTCSKDGEMFNRWAFNLESGHQYTGGESINPWRYHGLTVPTFTAQYGQCPEGEVPVDGECKKECIVPCTWQNYPANPAPCPNPPYPAGTTCHYTAGTNPAYGYRPNPSSRLCLDIYTGEQVEAQTCSVDMTQDPTCPAHYHWNSGTFSCDPDVYTVTLDPNRESYQNNTIVPGSNNVNELKEKWEYGWSKDGGYQFVTDSLILNTNTEVPYWTDGTKVFDGYWTTPSGIGYRMVQANGSVSQNGYQLLPATTITSDTTWYARYVDNPGPFTVTFRCDQDDAILNTQNPSFGDYIDVLVAPQSACTNHPGETFNQWRIVANGTLIPAWYNGTYGMYPWQLHEGSQIVPDWRPVYKVTLDKGATDAVNGNITSLWDAVGIGWYTNSGLTDEVDSLSDSDLPTRSNYTFAGYVDSVSGNPRGQFGSNNTWTLPETTDLTSNETWRAEWSRCPDYHYYDNNQCKECDSNYHQNPHPVTHEDCYTNCQGYCQTTGCTTGQNHVTRCDYIQESYTGFIHWPNSINGQCPNSNGVVPSCDYCVQCEDGWVQDSNNCKQCIEDAHFIVTLNPHLVNNTQGSYSSPRALYTWHGKGVYLYDDYSQYLMNGNQNPLVSNPQTYATVTFNLNGDGAWLDWENQRRTDPVDIDVPLTYLGFYKSETDSDMVINTNRYIEPAGTQAGKTATANLEWHAHWQPRQIGTVTGSQLPQPSRPGFNFVGWFNTSASNGGTQIYATTTAAQNMTVYARWSDRIYTVNLVSDSNNCQSSNNTPTELYEKYNVGWNRSTTGTFDRDLLLNDDELPTPNVGYIFDGYYDAPSGGQRVIRSDDGRVIQEPNYTDDTHTWYARCVRPNGPFTVTFKCDTDGHNVQSGSVNYGASVTAPAVADANCTKPGHTFNKWKAVVNNENVVFSAGETYRWGYYSGADFVPQWVLDAPYHVTLLQNDATQQGVTDLYEKYGLWWSLYQNGNSTITQLSGNALPRKTGSNFRGYQNESGDWMGTYNSTTGVWRLPSNTTVTSDETWKAQWDICVDGEYWLNGICKSCSKQTNGEYTHSDPGATSETQCYKECDWSCTQNGCPGTQPTGMSSCTYGNVSGNGIQYNVPGATCQLQGQPNFPQNSCQACTDCCPMNITCDKGYDLVGCVCRDNRYTITLDSDLYNGNGTRANPSTLYTWFNHGVYRDFARTLEMTPNENPLAVETPSTFATVTLNGNGVEFNWHDQYGPQLQDNVDFVFDGFYDTTGAAIDPVIGIDRHITEAGQSLGTTAQNNQRWLAKWLDGSVDLPSISRDGYTFDGWWTECNGGTRVSMGNQTITVPRDLTLCAHWKNASYTAYYNCGEGNPNGNYPDTTQNPTLGNSYNVLANGMVPNGNSFITCSRQGDTNTNTPAGEFSEWKANGLLYQPGIITWNVAGDQTFIAQYRNCVAGEYYQNNKCNACESDYTSDPVIATQPVDCYKDCRVQCIKWTSLNQNECPAINEEGVAGCVNAEPLRTYPGIQHQGGDCEYTGPETDDLHCDYHVVCDNGYNPDANLKRCIPLGQYEITLDQNGGTGGQEKLYTIHNTGVYLDPARTWQYEMTPREHPLIDLPTKEVTATFNHCDNDNENCDGANETPVTIGLALNGYYSAQTNGTQYLVPDLETESKLFINNTGMAAGKGYTDNNNTWYAHWTPTALTAKWPDNPTRPVTSCGVTYGFVGWYTEINGGTEVPSSTPISEDVTWYAHWCESCPTGTITNGSCSDDGCVARFTCNNGYVWKADNCSCTATTGLTLTYKPNGGVVRDGVELVQQMTFGQSFTTLGDNDVTKPDQVNCEWVTTNDGGGYFPLLDHPYTYDVNSDTTLQAHWVNCRCNPGNGVARCSMSVENNACVPVFECKDRFVTNDFQVYTCTDDCNPTCTVNCTECPEGWISNENHSQCIQCEAGTYQVGNECKPCPEGFTSNAGATSCYGNTITIDWDENGGNEIIPDGSCVYGETFTLANAPTHNNSAMQFLGWKLANDEIKSAGASVMCDFTHVGVYSGTTYEIQAQWNECQCNYSDEDHVQSCQPINISGICMCFAECEDGYKLIDETGTCTPSCIPETYSEGITYKPNGGTPNRNYTQSVAYNATFTTFDWSVEHYTKAHHILAGWAVESGGVGTFDGTAALNTRYTYRTDGPTSLLAKWTECANDEISFSTDNECHQCTCDAPNCNTYATDENKCACDATCPTGYTYDGCNCRGTVCEPICNKKQSDAIYECGDGATDTPPATQTMNYGDTHTVQSPFQPQGNCSKPNHTFMTWLFSGDGNYHNPGDAIVWRYTEDKTFTGKWCETCVQPSHGSCEGPYFAGSCSYDCSCESGYRLVGGVCTAHPVCEPDDSLTITYRPNGGVNPRTGNNQPVLQPVTYWANFTTLMGTTFTMDNHILTRWNLVGDDTSTFDKHRDPDTNQYYAKLNEYYDHYNTLGDTILDAHWEQCTCAADNCTTSATDSNTCACSATCPTGYTYGGCNCNGTVCAPTCTQCAETEISINNECVECKCTPGAGAATCGTLSTIGNICEWTPSCLDRFVNVNANCTGIGNTTCNPTCTECTAGWISNANHTECEICPANTYQSGNTCVDCPTGYTSPAGSSSADACVPGAHTIHYLSNNGANETYNQGVYYGQSFRTEGGTRFTKTNHIMTRWNVESGASSTFTNGSATLSGNYVYNDATDTTLSAQWAQCTCEAGTGVASCETYSNANACDATVTCETGYSNPQLNCNGTTCTATCTLGGSNAVYKCGTGIGTGYSTYVNYGATHTILTSAFVGCYRDNSTFAGWAFNGDNNMYFDNVGATVRWDYTTDKEFEARWCSNCPVVEHGTNLLTIPEPGLCRCDLTCDTGYHVENGTCEPNVYPNENGITYKPNGGTPNRNYTQSVTYDAPFTTLDWSVEHYTKAHHILKGWDVESGGAGTFNGGYADLGREYIYKTDGATSLLAKWIECGINEISLDNRCQQCQCTDNNAGVTSCETSATNNDTCSCSGECAAGYINAGCNCNGTNCTQSCTKCADNQVSVNNACENCKCEKNIDGIEGIISGCGFVSNNGNTCNWDPTTCRLGYGYPDLTCTETEHNNNCTASCTICPAGTYGDNGVECKPCPEGKTSLAGATSIRECFIDPNSCGPDEHIEHGECVSNKRACSIPDATSAVRIWNPAIGTYGPCTVEVDGCNSGYHVSGNVCVKDTEACTVEHGHGERDWNGTSWGACGNVICDPGYEPNSDYTNCVECYNRHLNGDVNSEVVVSSYVSGCEIAACMYQGQKYALEEQFGEKVCVPICTADRFTREDPSNPTGTIQWDERTKKCIRTCNPGYKMW